MDVAISTMHRADIRIGDGRGFTTNVGTYAFETVPNRHNLVFSCWGNVWTYHKSFLSLVHPGSTMAKWMLQFTDEATVMLKQEFT